MAKRNNRNTDSGSERQKELNRQIRREMSEDLAAAEKDRRFSRETAKTNQGQTSDERKNGKKQNAAVKRPPKNGNEPTKAKQKTQKKATPKKEEKSLPVSAPKQNRQNPPQNGNVPPKKTAVANAPAAHSEKKEKFHPFRRKKEGSGKSDTKIRVIPLGGLAEIGKNLTVIEVDDDLIVIDCGLGFPDEDMPGVDLVIPDFTYLEQNLDRVRGVFLTHGHEDHIGGIPYLLRTVNVPVYGTPLTLGIVKGKLSEHRLPEKPDLVEVNAGDTVFVSSKVSVEFIHVNHSIADACALAIHTPAGIIVHSGDFKLDTSPIDGEIMDLPRLGELGKEGTLLLLCESTNAERPGYTPSEKVVGRSLAAVFALHPEKRIVIATFSSNVHRVQQIIDVSVSHGRKVAITGRSMQNVIGAAISLGYMNVPEGTLIDATDIKRYRPQDVTLITTGTQGEPMSALYRMAFGTHSIVSLDTNDLVVLSSSPIPGNEKLIGKIINELTKNGIEVHHDPSLAVHVSGHACQEELKLLRALLKPKYFMPIHGEWRHLSANRQLALDMGMPAENIFLSEIGKVLEITRSGAEFAGIVPAGNVLVDGYGVGDVSSTVLRDRKHLSQDGLIVVVASVDVKARLLLSGPDIVSRGFVYVKESDDLMEELRALAADVIEDLLARGRDVDRIQIKTRVRDELVRCINARTARKPMVLPVIMDL